MKFTIDNTRTFFRFFFGSRSIVTNVWKSFLRPPAIQWDMIRNKRMRYTIGSLSQYRPIMKLIQRFFFLQNDCVQLLLINAKMRGNIFCWILCWDKFFSQNNAEQCFELNLEERILYDRLMWEVSVICSITNMFMYEHVNIDWPYHIDFQKVWPLTSIYPQDWAIWIPFVSMQDKWNSRGISSGSVLGLNRGQTFWKSV